MRSLGMHIQKLHDKSLFLVAIKLNGNTTHFATESENKSIV